MRTRCKNAPKSISAGAPPQTPLRELIALLRLPSWNKGVLLLRKGEGCRELEKERERENERREEGRGMNRGKGRRGTEREGRKGREEKSRRIQ